MILRFLELKERDIPALLRACATKIEYEKESRENFKLKYAQERSRNCRLEESNLKLQEGKYSPLLNVKLTKFSFNVNPVLYFPETKFFYCRLY